jgi:hypothetical protein
MDSLRRRYHFTLDAAGGGKRSWLALWLWADASAEAEEAVLAQVAAQGNHTEAAEDEVEELTMRSADVGFTALRASEVHDGNPFPENPELCDVGMQVA